jgi:hypothetical protein
VHGRSERLWNIIPNGMIYMKVFQDKMDPRLRGDDGVIVSGH